MGSGHCSLEYRSLTGLRSMSSYVYVKHQSTILLQDKLEETYSKLENDNYLFGTKVMEHHRQDDVVETIYALNQG